MTFCKHCACAIYLPHGATPWSDGRPAWHHKATGISECFSRDPLSPVAEPDLT